MGLLILIAFASAWYLAGVWINRRNTRRTLTEIRDDLKKAGWDKPNTFLCAAMASWLMGSAASAAPLPAAVVKAWESRARPVSPYDFLLPDEKTCEDNYRLAGAWARGVCETARSLGYYGAYVDECGSHWGDKWLDSGGVLMLELQAEVEECEGLGRVWYAARTVRWIEAGKGTLWDDKDADEWLDYLRELIGAEAWVSGRMPAAVPWWRVPRGR